jgi:60 kDa SS-A/Ro ribonucleoprotein
VLGVDGGTYYATERELTRANAGVELVDEAVSISVAGRAPRNNATLFALAAAAALGDAEGRKDALAALPKVARTDTHLFLFTGYVEQFRGWGRGLRRAVADWYLSKPVDAVAYQVVKYRQREGWSHRDLLRLAHPATDEAERKQLFDWICGRGGEGPALAEGFRQAQSATTAREWVAILDRYPSLSWEMLPDAALGEADV